MVQAAIIYQDTSVCKAFYYNNRYLISEIAKQSVFQYMSDKGVTLLPLPLLRTVLASFPRIRLKVSP